MTGPDSVDRANNAVEYWVGEWRKRGCPGEDHTPLLDARGPGSEGSSVLPGLEIAACQPLAVPPEVMHHVVRVESSYNPYAIGVVGGRLARQPRNLPEALSTVRMLESRGYNFSLGLAQVNRYNLDKYGIDSYERAFDPCTNLQAGSRILAECYGRAGGHWGKSFSCYYSGNFATGYRHGYVQKIYASIRRERDTGTTPEAPAIEVIPRAARREVPVSRYPVYGQSATATVSPVASTAPAAPGRTEPAEGRAVAKPTRTEGRPSRIVEDVPVSASPATASVADATASPVPTPAQIDVLRAAEAGPGPVPPARARLTHPPTNDPASVQEGDRAFVF